MLSLRLILKINPLIRNGGVTQSVNAIGCAYNQFYQINAVTLSKPIQYENVRHYAKSKQKEKARNKGVKFITFKLPEETLRQMIDVDKYRDKLQKTMDKMQEDYSENISLRSTTGSLETIKVKGKGQVYELQEIAQIIRKNTKTIIINMASFPDMMPHALQAINKSGLNLNPQQDGTTLYVPIPKVTREYREELAKNAKALFHKYRDQIKNIQNEFLRKIRDNSSISQDNSYAAQNHVNEIAQEFISQAEKMYERKHKELLGN